MREHLIYLSCFIYIRVRLVIMSKRQKIKILKPDEYSQSLGGIIEREFFPDLVRLRSQHKDRNPQSTDIIDLTDSSIEEFHAKKLSTDEAAFRATQSLDRKRHDGTWTKLATPGSTSKLALRLHPPSQVPNHGSSKPLVHRENTRLAVSNPSSTVSLEAKIQGTASAKSVIKETMRRADAMVEAGRFDDDQYSLPPIDPREEVAVKLERDILRGGLRKKR